MSAMRVLVVAVVLLSLLALCCGQTNLIQNPSFETSLSPYWTTPLGVFDGEAGENRTTLGRSANLTAIPGPGAFSYDGLHSALFEGGTNLQSIQQQVAITSGHQYILSFFLMFAVGDTTEGFQAAYQFNTASSATTVLTNSNFPVQPPFWWTQFVYTLNAGSSDSSVNITFFGRDPDYGFLLDYVTLYDAGTVGSTPSVSAPPAPPALPRNPSNNLLQNGDFESGTAAPWRMPGGDNPFPISSGPGAYDFATKNGEDGCPQGTYCFVFGAPYSSLPLTQTLPIYQSNNYTLSFMYGTPGGYTSITDPTQYGSQFAASYSWGSGAYTYIINEVNQTTGTVGTTPVPPATHGFATVTQQLSAVPSGATTLNLRFDGYSWPTWYTLDYIVLTSVGPNTPNPSTPSTGAAFPTAAGWGGWAGLVLLVGMGLTLML